MGKTEIADKFHRVSSAVMFNDLGRCLQGKAVCLCLTLLALPSAFAVREYARRQIVSTWKKIQCRSSMPESESESVTLVVFLY